MIQILGARGVTAQTGRGRSWQGLPGVCIHIRGQSLLQARQDMGQRLVKLFRDPNQDSRSNPIKTDTGFVKTLCKLRRGLLL